MMRKREKDEGKPFLKYYHWTKLVTKIIKLWLLVFAVIMIMRMVFIELISNVVHFVRETVTSNPDGYLKDLFPNANRWGDKFDEQFLFNIDNFLRTSIIITLILLCIYVLLILLRHRNGEQAPIRDDLESWRVRRIIIKATGAVRRKTYKDEDKKVRKYKKSTVKANRRIRKCIVEIHTYNKYNATGMPPIKTYRVAFDKLDKNADDDPMRNKIKYIHNNLNSKIDASFSEVDDYQGLYTSNVEKQLEKPKESIIVKIRRKLDKDNDGVNVKSEYSYPLTVFKDRTETIEAKTHKAERLAKELQESISMHLSSKRIIADKSEFYVVNTSIQYAYTFPPNVKKLPNVEELQSTLDSTLDIEGVSIKTKGRSIVIIVPLPKDYQIPIDAKTVIEQVY